MQTVHNASNQSYSKVYIYSCRTMKVINNRRTVVGQSVIEPRQRHHRRDRCRRLDVITDHSHNYRSQSGVRRSSGYVCSMTACHSRHSDRGRLMYGLRGKEEQELLMCRPRTSSSTTATTTRQSLNRLQSVHHHSSMVSILYIIHV